MQIQTITVRAHRTLPHPIESFANVQTSIELTARLDAGDDPAECRRRLLCDVENAVEQHAAELIASIEDRAVSEREVAELQRITTSLESQQRRLAEIQKSQEDRLQRAQESQREQQTLFGPPTDLADNLADDDDQTTAEIAESQP